MQNWLVQLSAALVLGGCTSADRRTGSAQMNDLSVLYPLASTQREFDVYLSASSAGVGGSLLPQTVFGAVDTRGIAFDRLRLVALRLDPCFAHIGPISDPSTCKNQLRLI